MKINSLFLMAALSTPVSVDQMFTNIITKGLVDSKLQNRVLINSVIKDNSVWISGKNVKYHISSDNSGLSDKSLLDGSCTSNFAFITKSNPINWCELVLNESKFIKTIYIKNRNDKYLKNLVGGKVSVSEDGNDWKEIYTINKSTVEYSIKLDQKVKYIKLTISNGSSLALRCFMIKD